MRAPGYPSQGELRNRPWLVVVFDQARATQVITGDGDDAPVEDPLDGDVPYLIRRAAGSRWTASGVTGDRLAIFCLHETETEHALVTRRRRPILPPSKDDPDDVDLQSGDDLTVRLSDDVDDKTAPPVTGELVVRVIDTHPEPVREGRT
jgi:hypothetical protein